MNDRLERKSAKNMSKVPRFAIDVYDYSNQSPGACLHLIVRKQYNPTSFSILIPCVLKVLRVIGGEKVTIDHSV